MGLTSHNGPMWVVVVEPYYDGSHRAWADGYAGHSSHEVSVLGHRGSFWKWRMHGAALTLARDLDDLVHQRGRTPDAVLVSDMVDLSSFRGIARTSLSGAAVVAYFHENQLTYPLAPGALPDLSYGLKNWMSMAAADEVWFNSEFHAAEVARALPGLLGAMPDHRHTELIAPVLGRSAVMPVGITIRDPAPEREDLAEPPLVLWNQRWEYDKDPGRFLAAVDRAAERGIEFRLAIAGQSFRQQPAEFEQARRRHATRLVHFGEADPADYAHLLDRADVVVSTARHEFFGVAVAEAIAAGCLPVLPDALAYPEMLTPEFAHLLYDDDAALDDRFDDAIARCAGGTRPTARLTDTVRRRYGWPAVAERYDRRLAELISC